MSEIERTTEFGFGVGQDAGMLRKLGASDLQVCNYVTFKAGMIPTSLRSAYKAAARRGFTRFETKFEHPIYAAYIQLLQSSIDDNWVCLQSR